MKNPTNKFDCGIFHAFYANGLFVLLLRYLFFAIMDELKVRNMLHFVLRLLIIRGILE